MDGRPRKGSLMAKKTVRSTITEEARFRAMIEHAHDGIVLYDAKGIIQYASPAIQLFGGYKQTDLLGHAGNEFVHPAEQEMVARTFYSLKPGESKTFRQRLLHKKGHYHWGETTLTNQLHMPEIQGIISNFRDISDRIEAEEKADEFRQLLQTITDNVQDGIFLGEFGKRFIYANAAYLRISGFSSFYELQKVKPGDLFADEVQRKQIVTTLRKQGVIRNIELEAYRKDGKKFWARMTVSLLNSSEHPNQFLGTLQDITDQKEAELRLRKSQQLLSSISNNVQEGFFRSSPTKGLLYVNESYARLFGYRNAAEIIKVDPKNFYVNPDTRKKLIALQKKHGKVSNLEVLYKRRDGSTFLGALNSTLTKADDGAVLMDGVIRDITHLKKNEEEFFQMHANLEGILESTEESIYALDTQFRYLAFNANHRRIMKLLYGKDIEIGGNLKTYLKGSSDEAWFPKEIKQALLGKNFVKDYRVSYKGYKDRFIRITFNPIRDKQRKVRGAALFVVDVTEQKKVEERARQLLQNLSAVLESTRDRIFAIDTDFRYLIFNKAHAEQVKRASGKTIKQGDNMRKLLTQKQFPEMEAQLKKVLKGDYLRVETILPNGSIAEVSYSPVKDENGKVAGAAAFMRDVTVRKQAEQKIQALNEELVNQNWKLEAREEELKIALEELSERNFELDQFMYKTSHDLRSPLSSVLGLVNLAKLDHEEANVKEYLLKIEGRIRKLDEFVRSMLNYAKVSRAQVRAESIDIEAMANACVNELEYLENFKKVNVTVSCITKAAFHSDAMTLRLILANIISNAFKYYNAKTESKLEVAAEVNALRAIIIFSDNGIGIQKEYLGKIFDMFFRATERSEGSGLGMYIVKQAVDKLNGRISIESEYGHGTTIKIVLPNL
jgi:PAS domain S-box-containing protein